MDIAWRLVYQIIHEFEPVKAHMIKNGKAAEIETFLMKSIPDHLAQRKEADPYRRIDMSNVFRVIVFLGPSPRFREFCLTESWLEQIIKSPTDVMAIVELLKSFDNQVEVLAMVCQFAHESKQGALYQIVIQKLLES
jgi:hypothetical protein